MKKIIYRCILFLMGASIFASCSNDDPKNVVCPPAFTTATDGVFILHEGSYFNGVSGSLAYLDYTTWDVSGSVFLAKNGRELGGTPNDILIYGSKMYIATTDENRIEVVDAATVQSIGYMELTQPRKLTACDGYVYVSSYEGVVSRIDTTSLSVVATSEKIGNNLEGITPFNGYLYVCNAWNDDYSYNTNVVKLNVSDLSKVKDIEVRTNPTRIITDGTYIYLQSTGNYSGISSALQRIDIDDNVSVLTEGVTYMAYYGNKIYCIYQNYGNKDVYKVYDLLKGEVSDLPLNADDELFSACAIAADPNTGILYVSSYAEGEYGYPSYAEPGYIVAYMPDGTYTKFTTGVAPTSYAFKTSTHISEQ
ncbi:MAG: hypothetical protein J1F40_07770 [Prevotellaceae bacterium]|nr:hypothetical protein [Prevotellaceae bacterium]